MAKVVPTMEEWELEYVENSCRAYVRSKDGCTDNWLRGILRASEPATVDRVLKKQSGEFQQLNPERFLRLGVLWNEVRFD